MDIYTAVIDTASDDEGDGIVTGTGVAVSHSWTQNLGIKLDKSYVCRGIGVFADDSISKGDTLFVETAIMRIERSAANPVVDSYLICSTYESLEPRQKSSYDELFATDAAKDAVSQHLGPLGWDLSRHERSVLAKFMTNYVTDLEGNDVICPIFARVNHSCMPNAVHRWNVHTNQLELWALRDIEPEQEILISYIWTAMPLDQRRQKLREPRYAFVCGCGACGPIPDESYPPGVNVTRRVYNRTVCEAYGPDYQRDTEIRRRQMDELVRDLTATPLLPIKDRIDIAEKLVSVIDVEWSMKVELAVAAGALAEVLDEDGQTAQAIANVSDMVGATRGYSCYGMLRTSDCWNLWHSLMKKHKPVSEHTLTAPFMARHITNLWEEREARDPQFFRKCLQTGCGSRPDHSFSTVTPTGYLS